MLILEKNSLTVASKRSPIPFPIFVLPLTSWLNPVTIEITQTTEDSPKMLAVSCVGSLVEGGSPIVACTPPKEKMDRTGPSEPEGVPQRTHSPKHTNVHDDHDDNLLTNLAYS